MKKLLIIVSFFLCTLSNDISAMKSQKEQEASFYKEAEETFERLQALINSVDEQDVDTVLTMLQQSKTERHILELGFPIFEKRGMRIKNRRGFYGELLEQAFLRKNIHIIRALLNVTCTTHTSGQGIIKKNDKHFLNVTTLVDHVTGLLNDAIIDNSTDFVISALSSAIIKAIILPQVNFRRLFQTACHHNNLDIMEKLIFLHPSTEHRSGFFSNYYIISDNFFNDTISHETLENILYYNSNDVLLFLLSKDILTTLTNDKNAAYRLRNNLRDIANTNNNEIAFKALSTSWELLTIKQKISYIAGVVGCACLPFIINSFKK